jgi:hypothetical protein
MVDVPFFEMPQTAEKKIQRVTCPPITLKKPEQVLTCKVVP